MNFQFLNFIWKNLRLILIAIASIIYFTVNYLIIIFNYSPKFAFLIAIMPWLAATVIAIHSFWKRILFLLSSIIVILIFLFSFDLRNSYIVWIYFIQHAGTFAFLGVFFGNTLSCNYEQALCSQIASYLLREALDDKYMYYTWKVTLAWTVFFYISAILSSILFFWGSLAVWSAFANLLTPLLVGAMFVGEYLIRIYVMPKHKRFSILETIQAYREYSNARVK